MVKEDIGGFFEEFLSKESIFKDKKILQVSYLIKYSQIKFNLDFRVCLTDFALCG